jgi:hypothetical protein
VNTVSAEFGSVSAAEGACHDLVERGFAAERIRLLAHAEADPVAAEYPGQPFANQPGQAERPPGDAARSFSTCSITVEAGSPEEAGRIAEVLERHGARLAC